MRVIHITETMASGVLRYLQEVVRIKDHVSYEHYIVYSKRKHTPNDLAELFPDSVHLIYVDMNIKRSIFDSIKSLYKHIKDIDPDVIHLHSSIAGFLGRLITRCFPKKKVFYTPHGYSFLMTNKTLLTRAVFWLAEFMLSQLNGNIVACSKSEYRYAKILSPFRKVFLLENCTNISQYKNEKSYRSYKQVIGVGRLEEQKNPKLFIEIVADLRKINPAIKAVWVGDGSLKKECEELNRSLNAEVMFTGWLSNEETIEYLKDSTVFLQTSKWEGLPYSILESFALGIPVVASDISSHRDLIGNEYLGFIAKDKRQFLDYTLILLTDAELVKNITSTNKIQLEQKYKSFSQQLNIIYSKGLE